jgi:hypothetical protein
MIGEPRIEVRRRLDDGETVETSKSVII